MTDSPRAKKKQNWNYEATVAKVEKIISQLESGELELAEVFTEFSTAVEYLRECEAFLNQKQQQMTLLIETLAEQSEPF